MRAVVVDEGRSAAVRQVPLPGVESECLIRVTLAGICGTDLQILEGYAGFRGTPGHEFVGTVVSAPPGEAEWIGARVVGEINVGCGRCGWCAAGAKEHCPARSVLGIKARSGAFADYLSLPAANLHRLPDHLDDQAAVFVEPTAAASRILEQVSLTSQSETAIVGDGRLALLIGQVLRTMGASVTVFGRHEWKLGLARELGLTTRPTGAVQEHGGAFQLVIDATGRPAGLHDALALVQPRGTLVLKSTFHGAASLELWPAVVNEVRIIGSRCGPFRPALDLLARGSVRTAPLVSRVLELEEFDRAVNAARSELKVLIRADR